MISDINAVITLNQFAVSYKDEDYTVGLIFGPVKAQVNRRYYCSPI